MAPVSTFLPFLLAGLATARFCTNVTIPIDISYTQGKYAAVPADGNLDAGAFALAFTRAGQNYSQTLFQGFQTQRGSYNIAAKFCRPDKGSGSTVQLLSHGIGFDKSYWDLPYNNFQYSYVDVAVAQGYSTLAIDRFGIGGSSHADPINIVQAQAEVEALNAVTTKLRLGQIPSVSTKFSKVIHVGHSFGSIQSLWLSAQYPDNTDGLVLTGYAASAASLGATIAAWNLHSARLNQPLRLGNAKLPSATTTTTTSGGLLGGLIGAILGGPASSTPSSTPIATSLQTYFKSIGLTDQESWNEFATTELGDILTSPSPQGSYNYESGYLVHSDLTALQYVFLLPGSYETGLAVYAEQNKHPVAIGEILSLLNGPSSSKFDGPVLVFTGRQDEVFCGGDCFATGGSAPSWPAAVKGQFPNASQFDAFIQPSSGHGLNLHYNATAGYKVIQNWLGSNGLGA